MKLEELARQSSAAARTSVSRLDPPPIGEPDRPRWLVPAVAGVAVTALVVGGLAVINRNGGDGEVPAPATVPEVADPPRLAFGPGVEGWQAISAMSLDEMNADADSSPSFVYYGTIGADDPFVAGDLMIGTIGDLGEPAPTDGVEVAVRGTTGQLSNDLSEIGIEVAIEWAETDAAGNRLDLVVASRSFDQGALVAIIENLVVDVAAGTVAAGEDLDLDRLVESDDLPLFGRSSGDGWLVSYIDAAGDDNAYAVLTSAAGSLQESAITLRWWSNDVENVLVDGAPGLLTTVSAEGEASASRTLTWSPEPGVVASISVFSGGPDDLIGLAEGVVELTPADWSALVDQTQFPDVDDGDGSTIVNRDIVAEGDGELDGETYTWVVSIADGNLCVDVQIATSGAGSCDVASRLVPPADSAGVALSGQNDRVLWAAVVADADVEAVRPVDARFAVDRFKWSGSSWFIVVGPISDLTAVEVIADGEVIDTLEIAPGGAGPRPEPVADGLATEFPILADDGHRDVVFIADGETDGLRWGIGESSAGLCLYTAGITDSISCNEFGAISVFAPISLTDGDLVVVFADSAPACLPSIRQPVASSPVTAMTGPPTVIMVRESVAGWQLNGFDRDGDELASVSLPERGSTTWPERACQP